jgi:hypothetical protein
MASDESIESILDISTQYSVALADLNNDPSVSLHKIAQIYDYLSLPYKLVGKKDNQQRPFRQINNGCQCMRRML